MRGLITAIRTLTVARIPGRDSDDLAGALPYFPVVGGLIGVVVAGLAHLIGARLNWPSGAGVLCVAATTIITGGLHLDGLADAFDSFGGGTRERKLEIMKDPRIGSFGVMAICLCLLAKFSALTLLSAAPGYARMALPFVLSRTAQVGLIVNLPYARPEGGTAAAFVAGAKSAHFYIAAATGAALSLAISLTYGGGAIAITCAIAVPLAFWMRRVFGGVTGDLIGMAGEIIETALLVALALSEAGHFHMVWRKLNG